MRRISRKRRLSQPSSGRIKKSVKKKSSPRKIRDPSITFEIPVEEADISTDDGELMRGIRSREKISPGKTPSTSSTTNNKLSGTNEPGSAIRIPIFRQVPPLNPLKTSGRNIELEQLQKRHERLEAEEKMLIRQDRIWQNEQKRNARLLKTPLQSDSEVPLDLKLIVHRKIRF